MGQISIQKGIIIMSFGFGRQSYTFVMISLVCWVAGFMFDIYGNSIGSIVIWSGILIFAVLAIVYGKKEVAADPTNTMAKMGFFGGLIVLIIGVVFLGINISSLMIG